MDNAALQPIVAELVSKPGHEKVRTLLHKLLTDGLGAESTSIDFEKQVPEVRGRIDAPAVAGGDHPGGGRHGAAGQGGGADLFSEGLRAEPDHGGYHRVGREGDKGGSVKRSFERTLTLIVPPPNDGAA